MSKINENNKTIDGEVTDDNSTEENKNDSKDMSNTDHSGSTSIGKSNRRGLIKFSISAFIAALAFGVGAHYIVPKVHEHTMNEELKKLQENSGSITVANKKLENISKLKKNINVAGSNSEQKYPTINGENDGGIIYTNGKNASTKKIVDLYIDLNGAKSKDFINLNGVLLKSLVENGKITLNIHPATNGNKNSILMAEALTESAVAYPTRSWEYLTNITKLTINDGDDAVEKLSLMAKRLKLDFIDASSINNGTFASWIYDINSDEKLKSGYAPPIIYVDNKLIDAQANNLNDSETLERILTNG